MPSVPGEANCVEDVSGLAGVSVPDAPAATKIASQTAGLCSFRVARFRIVYRIAAGRRIDLVAVGPRAIIYDETYRRIAKAQLRSDE